MSTENNLDKTFNSSVKILSDLIAFKSISGEDNNSIINYCEKIFNDFTLDFSSLTIRAKTHKGSYLFNNFIQDFIIIF